MAFKMSAPGWEFNVCCERGADAEVSLNEDNSCRCVKLSELNGSSMCHFKCHIDITRMPENPNSRVDTTHFLKVTYPFIVLFVHDDEAVAGSPVNNIAHFITAGLRFVCRQGIREPVAHFASVKIFHGQRQRKARDQRPGGGIVIKRCRHHLVTCGDLDPDTFGLGTQR